MSGLHQMQEVFPIRRANSIAIDMQDIPNLDLRCNISCPSTSRSASMFGIEPSSSECVTIWQPVTLRQEWTIPNISRALSLSTPGICMRSRAFCDPSMPDITWQLCLYPGGKREENKGHVSLFLKMSTNHTSREFTVRAEYCFTFLKEGAASKFKNVNIGDFKVKPSKGSHSWGLRNIPRQKVLDAIGNDDSLHILCQIEAIPDFNKIQTTVIRRETTINSSQLTQDYLNRLNAMYISGEGADFVIECENRKFDVHKFILMAHSDVFRAMFKHPSTIENIENKVVLKDTNPTAVDQMLTYMYSGSLPDTFLDEHASALMQIAEKYALDSLKLLCQEKLISRLSGNNVCFMLDIADTHNADLLLDACIPIVRAYSHRVITSPEWAELRNVNLQLVTNVLEKIVIYEDAPPSKRLKLNMQQLQR
ncbi:Speckle-type POZ protein [Aphelenchoides besseyi]|nr:Speckle-type POZ protein [Aphelenchoides besseyi]KAI6208147.1 Speckle-type POZ protein [Aphelenchoides besseyi]